MSLDADDYPASTISEYGYGFSTLKRIQAAIETFYGTAGVSLPARRFVAVGDVASQAWDCEQLTINLVQMYLGTPGAPVTQPRHCDLAMSGDFVVQLVRCVPEAQVTGRGGFRIPSVEDIEDAALVQAIDSQLLLEAAHSVSSAQGVGATVGPTGASGKFQAVVLNLHLSLFEN